MFVVLEPHRSVLQAVKAADSFDAHRRLHVGVPRPLAPVAEPECHATNLWRKVYKGFEDYISGEYASSL